jgi:hypothetical protein
VGWENSVRRSFVLNCYFLTNSLTPWSRVLLEKLTSFQLVKKFAAFCETRRFIIAFTSACHLSIPEPAQSSPYPHFLKIQLNIILQSVPGFQSGLLPSDLPTKTLYMPLTSPICATCPSHLGLLYFITWTILCEEYRSFSSSYVLRGVSVVKQHKLVRKMSYSNNETTCFSQ